MNDSQHTQDHIMSKVLAIKKWPKYHIMYDLDVYLICTHTKREACARCVQELQNEYHIEFVNIHFCNFWNTNDLFTDLSMNTNSCSLNYIFRGTKSFTMEIHWMFIEVAHWKFNDASHIFIERSLFVQFLNRKYVINSIWYSFCSKLNCLFDPQLFTTIQPSYRSESPK